MNVKKRRRLLRKVPYDAEVRLLGGDDSYTLTHVNWRNVGNVAICALVGERVDQEMEDSSVLDEDQATRQRLDRIDKVIQKLQRRMDKLEAQGGDR
jgi:hypothetical protein